MPRYDENLGETVQADAELMRERKSNPSGFPKPLAVRAGEHSALALFGRHKGDQQHSDHVTLGVFQRTTKHGEAILLDIGHAVRLVGWLAVQVGRRPDVEGYAQGNPEAKVPPTITVVERAGPRVDSLTLTERDGELLVCVTHHGVVIDDAYSAHITREDAGEILDWLAAFHLHGWAGVKR